MHTVGVVWVARERVAEEQGAGQGLGLGDLDGLDIWVSFFVFRIVKVSRERGLTDPDLRKSSEKDSPGATVVRGPVALPSKGNDWT